MAFDHETSHQGKTNTWLTPKYFIDELGPFDLDPCSAPIPRPWDTARNYYCEEENGLIKPWYGYVWCNPPYGPHTGKWLERLSEHNNGIALVFNRSDTTWFQTFASKASLILLISKRVNFCDEKGIVSKNSAGSPSILLAYGDYAKHRLEQSSIKGIKVLVTN